MSSSSRALARTWPYPRHRRFVEAVREAASTWFKSKGFGVNKRYPYILAKWEDWPKNIILPQVAAYIQKSAEAQRQEGLNFPLHKYIHHGLSSQAMLFNLVGPLLVRGDLSPLRKVLDRKGVAWPGEGSEAKFEHEDRAIFNEDSGQPTSIDLVVLDDQSSPKIFVEAKFTEQEFGGCSVFAGGDCDGRNPAGNMDLCYLHYIGRKYWSLSQKYGIAEGKIASDTTCILANHYQFFREAIFALEHGGVFVLLCDDRSPVFFSDGPQGPRGAMPLLIDLVPEGAQQSITSVTIQELVAEIEESADHKWVEEFVRKYGLLQEIGDDPTS